MGRNFDYILRIFPVVYKKKDLPSFQLSNAIYTLKNDLQKW